MADPFAPKFYSLIQNKIGDVLNFVACEQTLMLEVSRERLIKENTVNSIFFFFTEINFIALKQRHY